MASFVGEFANRYCGLKCCYPPHPLGQFVYDSQ
jgi:hypothetical protein